MRPSAPKKIPTPPKMPLANLLSESPHPNIPIQNSEWDLDKQKSIMKLINKFNSLNKICLYI